MRKPKHKLVGSIRSCRKQVVNEHINLILRNTKNLNRFPSWFKFKYKYVCFNNYESHYLLTSTVLNFFFLMLEKGHQIPWKSNYRWLYISYCVGDQKLKMNLGPALNRLSLPSAPSRPSWLEHNSLNLCTHHRNVIEP